jgi:hypothetical protein
MPHEGNSPYMVIGRKINWKLKSAGYMGLLQMVNNIQKSL